jgi:hypothetical protein
MHLRSTPSMKSHLLQGHLRCSVVDSDPGSGAFLTPGSRIRIRDGKKSESGMNIPDHFSETLVRVKNFRAKST